MTTKRMPPANGWKPGQSGNPAGRKPGTGEVAKLRAAMAAQVPALIGSLFDRALPGDVSAARLLLERTIAPLKAVEEAVPLTLPGGTMTDQGRAVMAAAGAGSLAPGQAAQLLAGLAALAKLTETDELARRIGVLEEQHAKT